MSYEYTKELWTLRSSRMYKVYSFFVHSRMKVFRNSTANDVQARDAKRVRTSVKAWANRRAAVH